MPAEGERRTKERLEGALWESLKEIRSRSERAVSDTILPHFTDHSIDHFDRVAEKFTDLINPLFDTEYELNEYELFVGMAACYLHDVALQSTRAIPGRSISELTPKDLEKIRGIHGKTSHNWIKAEVTADLESPEDNPPPILGVDYTETSRELGPYIAEICRYHQGDPDTFPDLKDEEYRGKKLRLNFLLRLLRLADALDLDSRRVRMEKLEIWRVKPDSLVHWWKHHYVNSVSIDDLGFIKITMKFPPDFSPPYIDYFVDLVREDIESEFTSSQRTFRKNGLSIHLEDIDYSQDYGESKRPLPEKLQSLIDKKIGNLKSSDLPNSQKRAHYSGENWIGYWGFKGNPWTDLPVTLSDETFIETQDLAEKFSEFDNLIQGKTGEIRVIFGDRGSGKTTFLQSLRDRYPENARVSFQDVSRILSPMSTVEELYSWIFPQIIRDISGEEPKDDKPGPSEMKETIQSPNLDHPLIVIDNLDRYSDEPDIALIKRFFQVSQGNLQAIAEKAIVVISASEEWRSALDSKDLSYIGAASFREIQPFTDQDLKELLSVRLEIASSSYEEVFQDGAAELIQRVSKGNPRRALEIATSLCRVAAERGYRKVPLELIESRFKSTLQNRIAARILQISQKENEFNEALQRIYSYQESVDKLGISEDKAWQPFSTLIHGNRIAEEDLSARQKQAIAEIGYISKAVSQGSYMTRFWRIQPSIQSFLDELSSSGISYEEFIEIYRLKPIRPPSMRKSVGPIMNSVTEDQDVSRALEEARKRLESVNKADQSPGRLLLDARFCLEYLLVAYSLAYEYEFPDGYILTFNGRTFENEDGYMKKKSPYRLRTELDGLMEVVHSRKSHWFDCYHEMIFLQKKSDVFLRDGSQQSLTEADKVSIKGAITRIYEEFGVIFNDASLN